MFKLKACHWRRSGAFFINMKHISNLFLVFILLTLNRYMFAVNVTDPSRRIGKKVELIRKTQTKKNFWKQYLFSSINISTNSTEIVCRIFYVIVFYFCYLFFGHTTLQTFPCLKSTMETLEQGVKYVQS